MGLWEEGSKTRWDQFLGQVEGIGPVTSALALGGPLMPPAHSCPLPYLAALAHVFRVLVLPRPPSPSQSSASLLLLPPSKSQLGLGTRGRGFLKGHQGPSRFTFLAPEPLTPRVAGLPSLGLPG